MGSFLVMADLAKQSNASATALVWLVSTSCSTPPRSMSTCRQARRQRERGGRGREREWHSEKPRRAGAERETQRPTERERHTQRQTQTERQGQRHRHRKRRRETERDGERRRGKRQSVPSSRTLSEAVVMGRGDGGDTGGTSLTFSRASLGNPGRERLRNTGRGRH